MKKCWPSLTPILRPNPIFWVARRPLGITDYSPRSFPHLGRDPHPLKMMQNQAPMLFRWTERMRNPSSDMVEFIGRDESLLGDDAVPDTLKTLLRRVASDYLPEIEAMIAFSNEWLADNQPGAKRSCRRQKPGPRHWHMRL
jgi:hypothetical protein